ncbi:MAG TPA: heat-inducible transcriptional repressor HrcA [Microbacteriaceae bacterium]|nr:heat-inducible transcriptional repressor HrcA [Microbacteriaceae bacterium]
MVSERGLEVLRVIVEDYVATREPVGSKSIVERHGFDVSAATIRNDMSILEDEGLIAAPHTSSGRIPTDKGYRAFVDQLAALRPLTPAQRQAIESFMGQAIDLEDVLARTVRLLSQLTSQVAVIQVPTMSTQRVRHIEVLPLGPVRAMTVLIADGGRVDQRLIDLGGPVEEEFLSEVGARLNATVVGRTLDEARVALGAFSEGFPLERRAVVDQIASTLIEQAAGDRQDRLVMAGAANLARTEPDFPGSITPVLEAIEEQVTLLRLFREMELDQHGVAVRIGRENDAAGLIEASVLAGEYQTSGGSSRVGLLGPTRMDYSTNIAAVRAVARYLSKLLGERG